MSEYNIEDKGLKKDSEASSAVSTIVYKVENTHVKDLKKEEINKQIGGFIL
jgi:hypothetical protein